MRLFPHSVACASAPPVLPDCRHRRSISSSGKRVTAEEAVQILHAGRDVVWLVEIIESLQFGLDEAREHFDWRCDSELFTRSLASDDFIERATHIDFLQQALRQLGEEHGHLA